MFTKGRLPIGMRILRCHLPVRMQLGRKCLAIFDKGLVSCAFINRFTPKTPELARRYDGVNLPSEEFNSSLLLHNNKNFCCW